MKSEKAELLFTNRPLDESTSWLPYPKTEKKNKLPTHGLPSYLYPRSSIIFISYHGKIEKFKGTLNYLNP